MSGRRQVLSLSSAGEVWRKFGRHTADIGFGPWGTQNPFFFHVIVFGSGPLIWSVFEDRASD